MQKRALVLGGTGLVGSALLQHLFKDERYQEVRTIHRQPMKTRHPKHTEKVTSFDQLDKYRDFFAVDDLFCCLGTTIKKAKSEQNFRKVDYEYPVKAARLAKAASVKKLLIITAIGANKNSMFFYPRVKGELEETLMTIGIPSLFIFRPSLLLGDRLELRFGERMESFVMKPLSFMMRGVLAKYRPIEAEAVAKAMIEVANQPLTGHHLYQSDQIAAIAIKHSGS